MSGPSSQAKKQATRSRILGEAAKLFRTTGIERTSIQDVMKAAGLTVGGFYAHFKSKEELVVNAFQKMLMQAEEMAEKIEGKNARDRAQKFFRTYLSRKHRDTPERGCALASLAEEFSREGDHLRRVFAEELEKLIDSRRKLFSDDLSTLTEKETMQMMALAVGALVLSRATKGTLISDKILDAAFDLVEDEIT